MSRDNKKYFILLRKVHNIKSVYDDLSLYQFERKFHKSNNLLLRKIDLKQPY